MTDTMDIEIFPCAGGMGEGFRRAGVEFDLMIEIDETHCDSYEANLGHRPTTMDARSLLELLTMGWRPPKPIRMLVADPPCTPWSRAGKRLGQDDPRDMLEGTCRIIAALRPLVYLIGNVPGLDDGPNLPVVQKNIGALSKHGYCTADFARLDSANYGVPQHRIRPFWFGHLKGPCIQWPAPSHGDPDTLSNLTLPGITELLPWVSCRQALGHLSPDELGRPIKLRHRSQNGVQQGSAPEAPARVVGTSNLSDGNVLLPPDAPRSGSKKRDRSAEVAQGDRVNVLDEPSATVTRNGGRARMGAASTLLLTNPKTTTEKSDKKRKRDEGRTPQGYRTRDADRPSSVITSKPARAGAGESAVIPMAGAITVRQGDHAMSRPDKPARTLTRNTHSDGAVIVNAEPHHPPSFIDEPAMTVRAGSGGGANRALQLSGRPHMTLDAVDEDSDLVGEFDFTKPLAVSDKHDAMDADDPSFTIRGGGDGHSAPHYIIENKKHPNARLDAPAPTMGAVSRGQGAQVVVVSDNHPASPTDAPSNTIRATTGGGSNRAVEWPWERPSTTVQGDPRLAPVGHHGPSFMSDADAVVISERAASILQGFPEYLTCACGTTTRHPVSGPRDGAACAECGQTYEWGRWKFLGDSKKVRWSAIGMAMPPPLAHAVATSVVDQLRRSETDE